MNTHRARRAPRTTHSTLAFGALLAGALVAGCGYDAPPLATLNQPNGGTYTVGDPLLLDFSEPVQASSLRIRVWSARPEDRTLEGEHVPGLQPEVDVCTPGATCQGATLTLNDAGTRAEIALTGAAFQQAKVPWQLEVLGGLTDRKNRKSGVPYLVDFQFSPRTGPAAGSDGSTEDAPAVVPFEHNVYYFLAEITDPVKKYLKLYLDIRCLPDGTIRIAGGAATSKGDAPENTPNLDEITLNRTDNGFGYFGFGRVTQDGANRFFQTDPVDIDLLVSGVGITLTAVRMNAAVVKNPTTQEDRLEGTLTYDGLILNLGEPFSYKAGNANFYAEQIPADKVPADTPRVCGDLCGGVTAQCDPPAGFPGDGFCDAETKP